MVNKDSNGMPTVEKLFAAMAWNGLLQLDFIRPGYYAPQCLQVIGAIYHGTPFAVGNIVPRDYEDFHHKADREINKVIL